MTSALLASVDGAQPSCLASPNSRVRSGTRALHVPLRVAQWQEPPRTNSAPTQAVVLFDIAFAASIGHHAQTMGGAPIQLIFLSIALYTLTATPVVWQWWLSSLFLCRFDSGDPT